MLTPCLIWFGLIRYMQPVKATLVNKLKLTLINRHNLASLQSGYPALKTFDCKWKIACFSRPSYIYFPLPLYLYPMSSFLPSIHLSLWQSVNHLEISLSMPLPYRTLSLLLPNEGDRRERSCTQMRGTVSCGIPYSTNEERRKK